MQHEAPSIYCAFQSNVDAINITRSMKDCGVYVFICIHGAVFFRFWLMDCPVVKDAVPNAVDLYREATVVPFMSKFMLFAKRRNLTEARLRVFCVTDDRMEKTLENQEHFIEVARSRDVEVAICNVYCLSMNIIFKIWIIWHNLVLKKFVDSGVTNVRVKIGICGMRMCSMLCDNETWAETVWKNCRRER